MGGGGGVSLEKQYLKVNFMFLAEILEQIFLCVLYT